MELYLFPKQFPGWIPSTPNVRHRELPLKKCFGVRIEVSPHSLNYQNTGLSQKSVDFVLCDKTYLSPKLAVELDDKSHERTDRQERDVEVERILKEAGMPLLRIANHNQFNREEIGRASCRERVYVLV